MCIVLELKLSNKYSQRGNPAILVGYPAEHSGYEVYLLEKQAFSIAREVYFLTEYESHQFSEKDHQFPVLENSQLLNRLFHRESDTTQDRFIDDTTNLLFTRSDDENCPNEQIEATDLNDQESSTSQLSSKIDQHSSINSNRFQCCKMLLLNVQIRFIFF